MSGAAIPLPPSLRGKGDERLGVTPLTAPASNTRSRTALGSESDSAGCGGAAPMSSSGTPPAPGGAGVGRPTLHIEHHTRERTPARCGPPLLFRARRVIRPDVRGVWGRSPHISFRTPPAPGGAGGAVPRSTSNATHACTCSPRLLRARGAIALPQLQVVGHALEEEHRVDLFQLDARRNLYARGGVV